MDKFNEQLDTLVKRIFGPSARLDGAIRFADRTWRGLRILLGRRIIGTGPTFQAALQAAEQKSERSKACSC
jgi:hypothetical protein